MTVERCLEAGGNLIDDLAKLELISVHFGSRYLPDVAYEIARAHGEASRAASQCEGQPIRKLRADELGREPSPQPTTA